MAARTVSSTSAEQRVDKANQPFMRARITALLLLKSSNGDSPE
jgi:hypothetical protein